MQWMLCAYCLILVYVHMHVLDITGQYGPVYRATLNQNVSVEVIAKPIRKSLTRRVEFNSYIHELSILVEHRHPNVAHIYGVVNEGECPTIITSMIIMYHNLQLS